MPKSPTKKQTRKGNARQKPHLISKIKDSNPLNEFNEGDDQDADSTNANFINALRHNLDQNSKKSAGHSAQFQSRKNALYASARKITQEFVKSSTSTLENVQATLFEIRAQEISFQKYHDDCQVVIASNKESLDSLSALYSPVWQALGQRRSDKLEAASTMLVNNAPRRREILRDISKKARQQLEHAKQEEKDAEDAAKLIEHFMHLLRR